MMQEREPNRRLDEHGAKTEILQAGGLNTKLLLDKAMLCVYHGASEREMGPLAPSILCGDRGGSHTGHAYSMNERGIE